jgi:hypothetical protein
VRPIKEIRSPADGGFLPPVDLPEIPVDEGPMRRELLRQIGALEKELTGLTSTYSPWDPVIASPERGPAVLPTEDLEFIRDEMLTALGAMHDRIVNKATAVLADEPEPSGLRALFGRMFRRRG